MTVNLFCCFHQKVTKWSDPETCFIWGSISSRSWWSQSGFPTQTVKVRIDYILFNLLSICKTIYQLHLHNSLDIFSNETKPSLASVVPINQFYSAYHGFGQAYLCETLLLWWSGFRHETIFDTAPAASKKWHFLQKWSIMTQKWSSHIVSLNQWHTL